jgi:hypothetical protein
VGEGLTDESMGCSRTMGLADVVRRRNHWPIGSTFALYNVHDGRSRGDGTIPLEWIGRCEWMTRGLIEFCRAVASCNEKNSGIVVSLRT